jgi:ribosome-associated protein
MNETKCRKVNIRGSIIRLDQFLKWVGITSTGGHAKAIIQDGHVFVNGRIETHRGRQLQTGDVVNIDSIEGVAYEVMGGNGDAH